MATLVTSRDRPGRTDEQASEHESPTSSVGNFIELLGDEHTRSVLEAIADEPMGGREIAETVSLSRPTVYRRLNELEDAGLIETTMSLCSDGHHHKQYSAVLETASLELTGDGLTATVRTAGTSAECGRGSENWSVADD